MSSARSTDSAKEWMSPLKVDASMRIRLGMGLLRRWQRLYSSQAGGERTERALARLPGRLFTKSGPPPQCPIGRLLRRRVEMTNMAARPKPKVTHVAGSGTTLKITFPEPSTPEPA